MGRYVIAVGGTGSKVLEAIVYAACADAFSAPGEGPLPALDLLSVDVDASCGNTTRLKRAAEAYEEARAALGGLALRASLLPYAPVHQPVEHESQPPRRLRPPDGRAPRAGRLLARTLFTRAEADLEYSEGFRGHPDLGVLFFADLLGALEDMRAQGQPDELNAMVDRMRADLDRGDTVQVLLTGSIFGGTGASGIPAVSRYLRHRFAGDTDRFVMGAVLMLPYYRVPPAGVDTEREIAVSSDEFLDKARTALQYYGMEGMVRNGAEDASGIFDAAYLLGLPPEHFVSARLYSTGSQSQENDAHMLEWLAARCAARFFSTGFRGDEAHNMDCYYYQWHTPHFCWDSFDTDAALYRVRYGAMMKAAAVYVTECYPALRAFLCDGRRSLGRVGYLAAFFRRSYPASARARLGARLDGVYRFFAFYINWMHQVLHTLPPAFRLPAEGEGNGLMDAATLDALHAALASLGSGTPDEAACRQVQRGLERLVLSPVPDRRDMARVVSALGGGARAGGPDEALAAFLDTLLAAVMEDL